MAGRLLLSSFIARPSLVHVLLDLHLGHVKLGRGGRKEGREGGKEGGRKRREGGTSEIASSFNYVHAFFGYVPPSTSSSLPPSFLTLYCVCMTQSLPTTNSRATIRGSLSSLACSNSLRASLLRTSRQDSPWSLGQ